ncbi:DUF2244 domain-containing protein [Thiogranum longum]|nr:DUF2244 domain-containing protein [Thiogranum longum]
MIRPNCSLPWRETVQFYLGMVIVSFSIAIAFAMKGMWLILPFAGLEMLVLGIALYVVARRSMRWQMLNIHDNYVDIVECVNRIQNRSSFQRAWVRVHFEAANIKGHPSRLFLGSHGRSTEIGEYLTEQEKRKLALQLREVLG